MANQQTVNSVFQQAFNKDFNEVQQLVMSSEMLQNEYLGKLGNVLGKIVICDYLKTDIPFMEWFWKEGMKYGDFELFRQTTLARYGEYDDRLDPNNHYNVDTLSQVIWSVYKDKYTVSMNTDLITAAFQSQTDMGRYISTYMSSVKHTMRLVWLERYLKMFQTHPIFYKMQSDGKDGKITAKEIWTIINKMKMVSTQFNIANIPTMSSENDLILVLNSKINANIQFDSVGGVYNFGDISSSSKIKAILTYDFLDDDTVGVILEPNSYWLDFRFDKSTYQGWAETLTQDNFLHQWVRGGRIGFVNGVRLVRKESTIKDGDKLDYRLSPFTHYKNGELFKDEPIFRDVTSYVLESKSQRIMVPTDVRMFIKKGLEVKCVGDVPTKEEVLNALKLADYRVDTTLIDPIYIDGRTIEFEVKAPYTCGSLDKTIEIKYKKVKTAQSK